MSTRVRRTAAAVLGAAVLMAGLAACGDPETPQTPGTTTGPGATGASAAPMPDLELPLLTGAGTRNLSEVERPTLVNVWATWCAPCRKEMPVIEEFAQAHAGVVDVLGINFQDPQVDAAKKFVAETGVTYPSVRDADGKIDGLAPFPRLQGLPFMAVVDADGKLVGAEFSIATDVSDLEDLLERHLPGVLEVTGTNSEDTQ